jgi:hypothetical protein
MKSIVTLLIAGLIGLNSFAQENMMLMPFQPLMDGVWKGEGKWKDGKPFKQEITYTWGLANQHVEFQMNSFLDTSFTTFGLAAEGVFSWDPKDNKIRFRSFDFKGGVLEGTVQTKKKQIHYLYDYQMSEDSTVTITDAWIWVKDDKYMNKVGVLEGEEWTEVYGEFYFWKK